MVSLFLFKHSLIPNFWPCEDAFCCVLAVRAVLSGIGMGTGQHQTSLKGLTGTQFRDFLLFVSF
jgi:hypothetical protein